MASPPYDDELISEEEAREVVKSEESLARGEGIPHQDVLAEFGLK
jgi:hypothetical protein